MDEPGTKVNIMNLLTDELSIKPEHIPDGPKNLLDFYVDGDGNSSMSEEDLQDTHKKLTDNLRTVKEVKQVDEFVNLFMTNDPAKESQPKPKSFEIKRSEVPRSNLKVKVSGGEIPTSEEKQEQSEAKPLAAVEEETKAETQMNPLKQAALLRQQR